jgi:hypothetical protein
VSTTTFDDLEAIESLAATARESLAADVAELKARTAPSALRSAAKAAVARATSTATRSIIEQVMARPIIAGISFVGAIAALSGLLRPRTARDRVAREDVAKTTDDTTTTKSAPDATAQDACADDENERPSRHASARADGPVDRMMIIPRALFALAAGAFVGRLFPRGESEARLIKAFGLEVNGLSNEYLRGIALDLTKIIVARSPITVAVSLTLAVAAYAFDKSRANYVPPP